MELSVAAYTKAPAARAYRKAGSGFENRGTGGKQCGYDL